MIRKFMSRFKKEIAPLEGLAAQAAEQLRLDYPDMSEQEVRAHIDSIGRAGVWEYQGNQAKIFNGELAEEESPAYRADLPSDSLFGHKVDTEQKPALTVITDAYFAEASAAGAETFFGPDGSMAQGMGRTGVLMGKAALVTAAVGGVFLPMVNQAYAAEGTTIYIPSVADLEGANNSDWQTLVAGRVVDGSHATIDMTAHPRNAPMSGDDPSGTVGVDGSFRWTSPLGLVGTDGAAWLELQADTNISLDSVYIYNQTPGAGSDRGPQQGQGLPVFAADQVPQDQRFAHDGDSITFELLGADDGKRVNVLFFTPPESGDVRLDLYQVNTTSQTEVLEQSVWMEGGMYKQLNRVDTDAFEDGALRVDVFRNGHNNNVFVYGATTTVDSVVDDSQDSFVGEGTISRVVDDLSVAVAPGEVAQGDTAYARIDVDTENTVKNVRVDWEGDGVFDTNTQVNAAGPYTTTIAAETGTPGEFNPVVRAVVVGNDGLDKVVNAEGTPFTVTEASPEATIVGLDYDGDGVADNVDANGDGKLDETIQMECGSGYQHSLVSENASGDYTATSTPVGMAVSVDGVVDYNPSCDDVGMTHTPTFERDGATVQADYQINNTPPPQIIGIDMDDDGVADVVDANGDNILDSVIDVSCSFPIAYEHQIITDSTGGTINYNGNAIPAGMDLLEGQGLISYNPPCSDSGQTFTPQFQAENTVGSGEWITIQYRVND